jgi:hypothetical protein
MHAQIAHSIRSPTQREKKGKLQIQNKMQKLVLFSSQKNLQNFSDFPSHQIFRRMHEVLNVDENKN